MNRYLAGLLALALAATAASAQDAPAAPADSLKTLDEIVAGLPKHDISGTALDPDGKPLKKADVWLYYARGERGLRDRVAAQTKTNRKGRFLFKQAVVWEPQSAKTEDVTSKYSVIVRKKDELMGFNSVIEGEALDNVTVNTKKLVPCKIRVTDKDKKPIEGALVRLIYAEQKVAKDITLPRHQRYLEVFRDLGICSGVTDAKGQAAICSLPSCSYTVLKDGYAEGHSNEGGAVILFPGAKASGTVKLPDGTPLAGAAVKAGYNGNSLWWDDVTVTDDQGRYEFNYLPTKGFRYSWMKPEEEPEDRESSLSLTAQDLRPGTPYITKPEYSTPKAGEHIQKDLSLARGVVVTGRVVDLTTQGPAANFVFNAYTSGSGGSLDRVANIRTGQDGTFSFTAPPNTQIRAYWEADYEQGNYIIDESWRSRGNQIFKKSFTEDTHLDDCQVKLWPVQPLKGKVVDETGKPVKAKVSIHSDARPVATSDTGEFTIKTAPTDREFKLYAQTEKRDKAGFVTLKPGTQEAVITLEPTRPYKGRVINTDGLPAAGLKFYADVEINGSGLYMAREEPTTDANGEFELKFGCPNAAYTVFWTADDDDNRDYAYGNAKFNLAELPPDGVIQLEATQYLNAILGRVTDAKGEPIANAAINALSQDVVRHNQPVMSDKAGEFVYPRLAPGTVVLRVVAKGFKGRRVATPTDNTDLLLQLESNSQPVRQQIRLTYPDGKPAAGVDVSVMMTVRVEKKPEQVTKRFRTGKNGVAAIVAPTAPGETWKGNGTLIVQHPGYRAVCRQIFSDEDLDLDIALEPDDGSGWDCKIVDEAGKPISGATVWVGYAQISGNDIGFGDNSPFAYPPDANGAVRITSFGRVPMSLLATAPGYVKSHTWLDPVRSSDENTVTLAKAASVAVTVTTKNDGNPLAGMHVSIVTTPDTYMTVEAKETSTGLYTSDCVPAGTCQVACGGLGPVLEKYLLREPPKLETKAGEHYDVAIVMEEGTPVRGRLAFKDTMYKLEPNRASVAANQDEKSLRGARIEEDGSWILYLLPGKYTLKALAPEWLEVSRDIEVEEGKPIEGLVLEFTEKNLPKETKQ
ncbi:MAG TPA: carboxypeptidase regulatory-like domain-containing protein [Candidatus Bathyarchaeia archaeon]|nr:carboxypeptidase regulatory-like domain-containing protein [Candidatus Bathyarchaeia archaeon]